MSRSRFQVFALIEVVTFLDLRKANSLNKKRSDTCKVIYIELKLCGTIKMPNLCSCLQFASESSTTILPPLT